MSVRGWIVLASVMGFSVLWIWRQARREKKTREDLVDQLGKINGDWLAKTRKLRWDYTLLQRVVSAVISVRQTRTLILKRPVFDQEPLLLKIKADSRKVEITGTEDEGEDNGQTGEE